MEISHYEEVPKSIAEEIIAKYKERIIEPAAYSIWLTSYAMLRLPIKH